MRTRTRMVALAIGLAFLVPFGGMTVPADAPAGMASAALAPRTGIWPVNFTFYGSAGDGWGFTNATMSQPGPNLTVYFADTVNMTLISNDTLDHNWFIDYDNSLAPNGNEPSSRDFGGAAGIVVVMSFVADRPGTWTYLCRFHQISMKGTIVVLPQPRPVNITLHGNAGRGWGFTNATLSNPGPPLVVLWGTRVNLTLIANDSLAHNWFIDYDNSLAPNGNEPSSPDFGGNAGTIVVKSFVADQTGNWTYLCRFHQASMKGNITIQGGPPPMGGPGFGVSLFTGMMLGALGVVFAFAAVYHVRAVRAAKRMK